MKFALIGLVFMSAVTTLLVLGFQAGSIPHYKIHQVTAKAYDGGECRLDGAKIVSIESPANPLKFTIQDEAGASVQVISKRHPPDNFKIGNGVGLRGYYRASQGVFEADDVTTACPSKYEAGASTDGKRAPIDLDAPGTTPQNQS